MQFSANLGFLWTDLALPDAIRAAKNAGFDAVECHWPYEWDAQVIRDVLDETALPLLGLNTRKGNVATGENGLAALPGRVAEARTEITRAIDYARATGAQAVHVMAGKAEGASARDTFVENLDFAATAAGDHITILIEPLNRHDAPGYFLNRTDQAADLISDLGASNLKLMFDCYHVGRTEGDVIGRLRELLPLIGHIQFASVPDRGAPDQGEVDYAHVFAVLRDLGWTRPLGAEYQPNGPTEATLGWMTSLG